MTLRYLLDTCVISEFARPRPERKVVDWLNAIENDLVFLSAVTIGEVEFGICDLPPSNRRTELDAWLNIDLANRFAGRVLPLDADTFVTWARLAAEQRRQGTPLGVMDSLIAATASHHKMVLVTRNVSDFAVAGLRLLNPWE